ncbi:MAG: beta-carotene 15,15'-dioxygenase, Brp/Blh family [Flavobacteriales bacterium]
MSELHTTYDYAFIGMGCANSLILMELNRHGLLANKRIVIYEPDQKVANDRTFCFWLEPDKLKVLALDQLATHSWSNVRINALEAQPLGDKNYYYLRSEKLYAGIRNLLKDFDVTWKEQELDGYRKNLGAFVFDSRPPLFEKQNRQQVRLEQSFYGWFVQTDQPIFDPAVFTMMDFSIPQNNQTQFMYVLPFTKNKALIEPTRFGQALITEAEATSIIENFLTDKNTSYQVLEKEQGCIPMCVTALEKEKLPKNWIRTGAGSGQLKPSTGYSFVRNLEDSARIVKSIVEKSKVKRRVSAQRFKYYDRLLLLILARYPSKGKMIFSQLFNKNKANDVLQFLDERSSIAQDIKIMKSLPILLFLGAAFLDLWQQIKCFFQQRSGALRFCLLFIFLDFLHLNILIHALLLIGLLAIGIPHGSLDHLYQNPAEKLLNLTFIFTYLAIGLVMILLWQWLPLLALLLFLFYTAWHFGQADFQHWKIDSSIGSFCWGLSLLAIILIGHLEQTTAILAEMKVLIPQWSSLHLVWTWPEVLIVAISVFLKGRLLRTNRFVLESILVLILSLKLTLITAFGLYFIFQHSWHGWNFLQVKLRKSHLKLWQHGAVFTTGAVFFFVLFMFLKVDSTHDWGSFFIYLSALSFPHVVFMHRFYKRTD